jgi:hypothetical protein
MQHIPQEVDIGQCPEWKGIPHCSYTHHRTLQADREREYSRFLLFSMDYFTKWPEVYAILNQEASTVADDLATSFFCVLRQQTVVLYLPTSLPFSSNHPKSCKYFTFKNYVSTHN